MAMPKLKALIEQVHRDGDYDLSTLDGCGAFTRACAMAVYAEDSRFVMLKKSSGRTHVVDSKGRRHAVDALLFLENGKGTSVDIIGKSRTPEAKPSWTPDVKARYTVADGFEPDYAAESEPTPEPEPPVPSPQPPTSDLEARVAKLEAWARSFPK